MNTKGNFVVLLIRFDLLPYEFYRLSRPGLYVCYEEGLSLPFGKVNLGHADWASKWAYFGLSGSSIYCAEESPCNFR